MKNQKRNTAPELLIQKANVDNVIAVMSGKGGVGKSTIAGLLSSSLQQRGYSIGLLDADITGPSIPKLFGIHQTPLSSPEGILPVNSSNGIKIMSINLLLSEEDQPVIWRGPLIGRAIQQFWKDIKWGDLDFLIIDLPPGTGDAALTVMQSLPLEGIILITSPQDLAGMVVRKAGNMAIHLGIQIIGVVENMSHIICPKCGESINLFGTSQAENTAHILESKLLGRMPLDTKLSVMCDKGEIENYYSKEFEIVVDNVLQFGLVNDMETSADIKV
ncbi:MAG: Mrp/NBP35 family ATP-binding protein [Anaerolineales bacterium]